MDFSRFYRKIDELKGDNKIKGINLSDIKRQVYILIIDDEEFSFIESLMKHEYNITQKQDLADLKDAEAYGIILCDIRGVGKFLKSDYEGAYLIKQLKEKYPEKTLIAYTANDYNASFQEYLNYADTTVPKGSFSLEDWTSLLDRLLRERSDPVTMWQKARQALIQAGIPTIQIAKYESEYVKAIQRGSFESLTALYSKKKEKGAEIVLAFLKAVPSLVSIFAG